MSNGSQSELLERLIGAEPEGLAPLIARERGALGEAEVDALAERARAAAQADPAESLRLAGIAGAVAEGVQGGRARALALRARGVALRAQARWEEALESLFEGARAAEEAGDPLLAAQVPIAATEALAQLGRYDEAFALASALEGRLRSLGAEEDAAKIQANVGNIHFQREHYAEARQCWTAALEYFQDAGQEAAAARLRMNLANVLTYLHRLAEALGMYEAARETVGRAGMDLLVAGIDGNIGFLQFRGGRYREALQAFARARQAFARLELPKDLAKCDREIADVYQELNLIPEAREAYERVLPTFAALRMEPELARASLGLGATLAAQGRTAEALESLARAEATFRREGNPVGAAEARLRQAECLRLAGRTEESRAAARGARRLFRRHGIRLGEARARLLLLELRVEDGESPLVPLRKLHRETEQQGFLALEWRVRAALARACVRGGNRRLALAWYRRAAEAWERLRVLLPGEDFKIASLRDKLKLYEELLQLLLEEGTPAAFHECFEVAERARSRALLELIAGSIKPPEGEASEEEAPEAAALLARLEELRAQLHWDHHQMQPPDGDASRLPAPDAGLPGRVRCLEAEYLRVRHQLQIAGARPQLDLREAGTLPSLPEIQAVLAPGERLVEYLTVGEEVLAFVLSREEFRTVRCLADRADVAREVERLRFQWSKFRLGAGYAERHADRLFQGTQAVLSALYEMLLRPLEPILPPGKIAVVPHGFLHSVPFHALHDGQGDALDRWEMAYAPSAAVLRACRLRGEAGGSRSLVFGVSAPEIGSVLDEVAALRAILPDAVVYLDGEALVEAVPREGEFRYLHFASHAVFRDDNPLFSGVRLADGWLVAGDLYRRRLDCSLATLSACQTGVNALAPGDEGIGLTRGFLHAGARAVVVSLWSAHDQATANLMPPFYRHMEEGMGRAAALRAAQQEVRSRYPHPYHWAPFALVGAR
jgi:tetratricopeptide (TPR) repeat protein